MTTSAKVLEHKTTISIWKSRHFLARWIRGRLLPSFQPRSATPARLDFRLRQQRLHFDFQRVGELAQTCHPEMGCALFDSLNEAQMRLRQTPPQATELSPMT